MKNLLWILTTLCIASVTCSHVEAGERTSIASNAETVIVGGSKEVKVRVRIITREVQIGQPSDGRPDVIKSSCTYSRYPCSLVDNIEIFINAKSIFVPRSVLCDLADLNSAEISMEQKQWLLTLNGGDASECYIVKLNFDSGHVTRKRLSSCMAPGEVLQETIYYLRVLK